MTPLADPGRLPPRSALLPGGMGLLLSSVVHAAALLPLVAWVWLGEPRDERPDVMEISIALVAAPQPVAASAPPPPAPPPPALIAAPARAVTAPKPPRPAAPRPAIASAPAEALPAAEAPVGEIAALPAAAAAAAPALATALPAADFSAYARRLLDQMERYKTYPPLSARRGEEGIVTLRLVLARDGSLMAVEAVGEAPRRLVEASLAAVQAAAPFPPVPADFTGATAAFTLPIAYRLH